mmetsp:Transcript_28838/g.66984  ORF Transcript_28838/g.66984 Transcript_28838/m.66984 type:complete len:110 (+) Transcript_28838:324-653(+)
MLRSPQWMGFSLYRFQHRFRSLPTNVMLWLSSVVNSMTPYLRVVQGTRWLALTAICRLLLGERWSDLVWLLVVFDSVVKSTIPTRRDDTAQQRQSSALTENKIFDFVEL